MDTIAESKWVGGAGNVIERHTDRMKAA